MSFLPENGGSGSPDELLAGLNEPQREAVLENSAPLLVLAGAGSGKTRVITTKIAWCIRALGIAPWKILAVTFTNKAAGEMRDRVLAMVPDANPQDFMIRTFHSFGAWFLRRHGELLGLNSGFTIYDDEDSLSLLASAYPEFKKKELSPYMKKIAAAKDRGITAGASLGFVKDKRLPEMFDAYQRRLHAIGNVDFADLIGRSIELLDAHPDIADKMRNRFRVILVDEYQDSNPAQFELLARLVGSDTILCVVGDDDQSIYRFRGAEIKNILSFPEKYPGTRIIKLEQNYRSTGNILAVAGAVISHNTSRHEKTLWTDNPNGQKPLLTYVDDDKAEARLIGQMISQDKNYRETAILYRTNAQSMNFELVLPRMGIPVKVIGSLRFYEREEVKDGLALVSLALNHRDEVSFRRMANKPTRGLGASGMDKLLELATKHDGDLFQTMDDALESGLLSGKAAQGITAFRHMFDEALALLDSGDNVGFASVLVEKSGLLAYYRQMDEKNETETKEGNLGALINMFAEYEKGREGIIACLENISLDPTTLGVEGKDDGNYVKLITMHNTKGLEFDRVFVTGLEDGLFPGKMDDEDDMEEERRLFYVAVTRARETLVLTSARRRMIWGRVSYQLQSPFIDEIPSGLLTVRGNRPGRGVYGWTSGSAGGSGSFPGSFPGVFSGASARGGGYGERTYGENGYGNRGGSLDEKRARSRRYGDGTYVRRKDSGTSGVFSDPSLAVAMAARVEKKKAEAEPVQDNEKRYDVGQRVLSHDYGMGEVVKAEDDRTGRQVIDVVFETGRKARFISRFAVLDKIGE
ncbi:ATP-dependent helicase [Parasphaerochaeta coccoides]|uniref:DNA 3'-5' helicase n=1 Tax=Parasphaerochaeta coccoides (strain ATCC BAA-1237 / DSM 17374 / SPN1) TaxID=760011 RepID=F4GL67_PARC1|nr:UvrD-helicase domain-containing protein [Parasphaerochaeta coccoides]AEC02407.1 UvrD/REP helicase [Parasphaerochaeta coccoides DSM 17374]